MTPSLPPSRASRDAFASFDLDSLLAGAARLRGERMALVCSSGARLNFAAFDERASTFAAHLGDLGLAAGDCLLIAGAARAATLIALVGALRAGLDVAMVPAHWPAEDIARFARQARVSALAAEGDAGQLSTLERLFAAAMATQGVRLLISLGGADADGAVELDPLRLPTREAHARASRVGLIITREDGEFARVEQHRIVAAGMELLTRATIGLSDPIFLTMAPTRFATLAAGPFAALLSGAPLHLHAPFDAARFIEAFDAGAPAHLVAPRALAEALAAAGEATQYASLLLCGAGGAPLPAVSPRTPVVDLDDFSELARARIEPMMAPDFNRIARRA